MSKIGEEPKQRVIQEYVPGKQITLAHIIANPDGNTCHRFGLDEHVRDALGILTITPSVGVIIASDIAAKSGMVETVFLDRFGGSLLIKGDVASVESALKSIMAYFDNVLHYECVEVTRT